MILRRSKRHLKKKQEKYLIYELTSRLNIINMQSSQNWYIMERELIFSDEGACMETDTDWNARSTATIQEELKQYWNRTR